MNAPLVSVIIPAYNYAHFLPETLDSVIKQTYPNWECIIVNDGSTDNTEEVALKYCEMDKRIKYYYKTNGGLSSARNNGLRHSTGDFIQFLDADDLIHPDKLKKQLEIFNSNHEIDICYSDFFFFDNKGNKLKKSHDLLKFVSDPLYNFLFYWNQGQIIPIHCAIFKKSIFSDLLFNEELRAKEDWVMWVELALKGSRFSVVEKEFAFYRRHEQSMVQNSKFMQNNFLKAFIIISDLLITHSLRKQFQDYMINLISSNFESLEDKINKIYDSKSYKVGNYLLHPKKIFKKWN